jgi:hypothetical protein
MNPSRPSTRNGSGELSKQESQVTAPGININTTVDRRFAGCAFLHLPGNSGGGKEPQLKANARSADRKGEWR